MLLYVCGYAHTHTLHAVGTRNVSLGVGMRHLESPKNPDGLKLRINIPVYVYEVHMYI